MFVYKITNTVNGMAYIGSTTDTVETRFRQHIYESVASPNRTPLYRAMNEYGIESFIVEEIAHTGSLQKLERLEADFIKMYNTLTPNGYNATLRTKRCVKPTNEPFSPSAELMAELKKAGLVPLDNQWFTDQPENN